MDASGKGEKKGTLNKLMAFFKGKEDLKGTKSSTGASVDQSKETPTANDLFKDQKSTEKSDSVSEEDLQKEILKLIESNINRTHFSEKKLETFCIKCFNLQNPVKFKESNERLYRFLYDDLKVILPCIDQPESIVHLMKMVVFFKVEVCGKNFY